MSKCLCPYCHADVFFSLWKMEGRIHPLRKVSNVSYFVPCFCNFYLKAPTLLVLRKILNWAKNRSVTFSESFSARATKISEKLFLLYLFLCKCTSITYVIYVGILISVNYNSSCCTRKQLVLGKVLSNFILFIF